MDPWPGPGGGHLCVGLELGRAAGPGLHIAQIPGQGVCLESTGLAAGPGSLAGVKGGSGRELPCLQTSGF